MSNYLHMYAKIRGGETYCKQTKTFKVCHNGKLSVQYILHGSKVMYCLKIEMMH